LLDVDRILEALDNHAVEYVIVGGMALVIHGSARVTYDLDVCYARHQENLERLSAALTPLHPRLRGAPEGLPFRVDPPTLKAGLNFTFVTDAGDVDFLGEISGVGGFDHVAASALVHELYGRPVRVMSLDALERAKRAAGRRKDLLALDEIAELRRRIAEGDPRKE
jgi:hypothetical protein